MPLSPDDYRAKLIAAVQGNNSPLANQDSISNIPRNRLGGMLADGLQSIKDHTGMVGNFLLGQAPEVINNMSYGFNPTTGHGMTAGLKPEAADLMNVIPFGTMAGMATKGYAKLAGRELANQIQHGTGMIGRNVLSPTMNMVEKTPFEIDKNNGLSAALMNKEPVDINTYAMDHRPPMKGSGAPLHDLTGGGDFYPSDVYSSQGAQYYGDGLPYDNKAFSVANSVKGNPDAMVTMYRAIPKQLSNEQQIAELESQKAAFMKRGTLPSNSNLKGSAWYDDASQRLDDLKALPPENYIKPQINNGDWVTLTKDYAKEHGESHLNNNYQILSKKVPARKLFTNGDSIHEFGYDQSGNIDTNLLMGIGAGSATGIAGTAAYKQNK